MGNGQPYKLSKSINKNTVLTNKALYGLAASYLKDYISLTEIGLTIMILLEEN